MSDTYIPYTAMKELITVLEKHNIPYSFGGYYNDTDVIQGHWLTIDAEIYTEELDENDHLYNDGYEDTWEDNSDA